MVSVQGPFFMASLSFYTLAPSSFHPDRWRGSSTSEKLVLLPSRQQLLPQNSPVNVSIRSIHLQVKLVPHQKSWLSHWQWHRDQRYTWLPLGFSSPQYCQSISVNLREQVSLMINTPQPHHHKPLLSSFMFCRILSPLWLKGLQHLPSLKTHFTH